MWVFGQFHKKVDGVKVTLPIGLEDYTGVKVGA
jgi:hypothetical protein